MAPSLVMAILLAACGDDSPADETRPIPDDPDQTPPEPTPESAVELLGDGVDNDDDGLVDERSVDTLVAGDIVITEFLATSQWGPEGGWLELQAVYLTEVAGVVVSVDEGAIEMPALVLQPGSFVVVGGSSDPSVNGGLDADLWFESAGPAADGGFAEVLAASGVVDEVVWDASWGLLQQASMSAILPDALANDERAGWCAAFDIASTGDGGTPGAPHGTCVGTDADDDGYPNDIDCIDTDPLINPGIAEIWYDGIDSDCSGGSDFDADGDGYDSLDWGGTDCDDTKYWIYLGADEQWYDGGDGNCDGLSDYDSDYDGWDAEPWGTDCDDMDPMLNPGAIDVPYNGLDEDCGGNSDYDADVDGYDSDEWGGLDCDDTNVDINPVEPEIVDDGIDQDCSGIDLTGDIAVVDDLVAGDLIITEIMHDSLVVDDLDGEWFEIWNGLDQGLDLFGLTVQGGAPNETFEVDVSILVEPGGYVLFARHADPLGNGGIPGVDFEYERDLEFSSSDQISATLGFTFIDTVNIGPLGITSPAGAAVSLDPDHYDKTENGLAINWCAAVDAYGEGDLGTPGWANPQCP